MDLCFYRGTGLMPAIIRWWTGAKYAHVEYRFLGGRHWGSVMGRGSGWLSPSTPDLVLDVGIPPWEEQRIFNWCETECECPYDWRGIFFAQLLNRARSTADAWFCSEACVAGLVHGGVLPTWLAPCTVSPGRLEQIWRTVRP